MEEYEEISMLLDSDVSEGDVAITKNGMVLDDGDEA
jgi:hypothetical protein